MSVKKIYSLTNRQQLVDLNGDTTNFDLSFVVKSIDGSPFYLIVVDQNTLDNNPNLDYKHVENGSMSGNIISDKNIYENYYLCIKSEKNCEVEVTIDKKEIPANIPQPLVSKDHQYTRTQPSFNMNGSHPIKPSTTNWKLILIVIIVICGGLYLYYLYNNKKNNVVKSSFTDDKLVIQSHIVEKTLPTLPDIPPTLPDIPPIISNAIVHPEYIESNFRFPKGNSELQSMIARLNSLPVK